MIATEAYFIGPDDSETCDGCSDAVDNNPYTLEDVPDPGSFECMSRCRHMVQLNGEAPDGTETVDWSSNLGFTASGDAADTSERYGFDPEDSTAAARAEAAGLTLDDLTDDQLAVAGMEPAEIAQYLKDNDLSLDDVDDVLSDDDAAAVRDEMDSIDYVPADEATQSDLADMLAAGASDSIDAYVDENGTDDLKALAAEGFADADSAQAYYLADALMRVEPGEGWAPAYDPDTRRWTVKTKAQRKLTESMRDNDGDDGCHCRCECACTRFTGPQLYCSRCLHGDHLKAIREGGEGSGNHGHAGRPGQVGGSGSGEAAHVPADHQVWYHGTRPERVDAIKSEGLAAGENASAKWYMLTTSKEQAAAYAQPGGSVLEYHIPNELTDFRKNKGSVLWPSVEHNVYDQEARAAAPRGTISSKYLAATHRVGDDLRTMREAMREGNEDSGNKGHEGRPGQRGGSKPKNDGPPSQKLLNQRARTARIKAEKAAAAAQASGNDNPPIAEPEPPAAPPRDLFADTFKTGIFGAGHAGTVYVLDGRESPGSRQEIVAAKMNELAKAYPQLHDLQEATAFGELYRNVGSTTHTSEYTSEYKAAEKVYTDWHREHFPDPALDVPKQMAGFGVVTDRQLMFDNSAYNYANHSEKTDLDVQIRPDGSGDYSKSISVIRTTLPKAVHEYLSTLNKPEDYRTYKATTAFVKGENVMGQHSGMTIYNGDKSAVVYNMQYTPETMALWPVNRGSLINRITTGGADRYGSLVTHETGHVLHNALDANAKTEWTYIAASALDVNNNATRSQTGFTISEYALNNQYELFAESFTMYHEHIGTLPGHIQAFFDKHLKAAA